MSDFIIEILEPTVHYLELENSIGSVVNNIEIEKFDAVNIEIVNTEKILASDLPDDIPFTKIKTAGVDGIDYYLDHYQFDCGTPFNHKNS